MMAPPLPVGRRPDNDLIDEVMRDDTEHEDKDGAFDKFNRHVLEIQIAYDRCEHHLKAN